MRNIYLNNGVVISGKQNLIEYLHSVGFDDFDIENVKQFLCGDLESRVDELEALKEDYEREADGAYCACRDLAQEINNVCDEFYDKYKSKAVINVLDTITEVVRQNRID